MTDGSINNNLSNTEVLSSVPFKLLCDTLPPCGIDSKFPAAHGPGIACKISPWIFLTEQCIYTHAAHGLLWLGQEPKLLLLGDWPQESQILFWVTDFFWDKTCFWMSLPHVLLQWGALA